MAARSTAAAGSSARACGRRGRGCGHGAVPGHRARLPVWITLISCAIVLLRDRSVERPGLLGRGTQPASDGAAPAASAASEGITMDTELKVMDDANLTPEQAKAATDNAVNKLSQSLDEVIKLNRRNNALTWKQSNNTAADSRIPFWKRMPPRRSRFGYRAPSKYDRMYGRRGPRMPIRRSERLRQLANYRRDGPERVTRDDVERLRRIADLGASGYDRNRRDREAVRRVARILGVDQRKIARQLEGRKDNEEPRGGVKKEIESLKKGMRHLKKAGDVQAKELRQQLALKDRQIDMLLNTLEKRDGVKLEGSNPQIDTANEMQDVQMQDSSNMNGKRQCVVNVRRKDGSRAAQFKLGFKGQTNPDSLRRAVAQHMRVEANKFTWFKGEEDEATGELTLLMI